MRKPVKNLARMGVISDVPDELLPDGTWTDSRNVRYRDGCAEKIRGYSQAFGELSLTAMWAAPISDGSNPLWVYASSAVLYATDGTTHANVSHPSLSYVATNDLGWTGGPFHGFMLANDGLTIPQSWSPSLSNDFTSLTAWPALVSTKVLRPFKDFIFALRITDNGTYFPNVLRWSDAAAQGALPASWDYTDPTNQAGITELAQTGDFLVDALPIRDSLVIYKENHIWLGDYIGLPDVFTFRQVFTQAGLLTENCAAQINSSQHLALTGDDVILHDGNSARSIVDRRMRRWLFNRINISRFKRCFVATDYRNREAIICFPEAGFDWPNMGLVWNWAEDSLYPIDLGKQMTYATHGMIPGVSTTFDNDSGTFDSDAGTFDDQVFSAFSQKVLFLDSSSTKAYQNDSGEDFNGSSMQVYANRANMTLTQDMNRLKRVKRIYPDVTGSIGDVIRFRVGTRTTASGAVSWSGTYDFRIGVDYKIDCRPRPGRIIDISIEYPGSSTFRLYGFDLEFDHDGYR